MASFDQNRTAETAGIRKVKTLVADDSQYAIQTLIAILSREGCFSVMGPASDGYQALGYVVACKPELVLMDYRMPHLNGIEATYRIKQLPNPPFVILVTSDDSPDARVMAKAAGADGFVSKNEDLRQQLHGVLARFLETRHVSKKGVAAE